MYCLDSACMRNSTPPNILILCIHNAEILNICMKIFNTKEIVFDKMISFLNQHFSPFFFRRFLCSRIVYTRGIQLVPELMIFGTEKIIFGK